MTDITFLKIMIEMWRMKITLPSSSKSSNKIVSLLAKPILIKRNCLSKENMKQNIIFSQKSRTVIQWVKAAYSESKGPELKLG